MRRRVVEKDGEVVFEVIGGPVNREGVDMEQFETIPGGRSWPFRSQELERRKEGDLSRVQSSMTASPASPEDAEHFANLAFLGTELYENKENARDLLDGVYDDREWNTPYGEMNDSPVWDHARDNLSWNRVVDDVGLPESAVPSSWDHYRTEIKRLDGLLEEYMEKQEGDGRNTVERAVEEYTGKARLAENLAQCIYRALED